MCRPVNGSREEACPGGHIGPPLRGVGRRSKVNGNWHETTPSPAGRDGARPLQGGAEQEGVSRTTGCTWGVASASQIPKRNLGRQSWSPRPTEATQVVPSGGPMYLRHGFRRPNFVPKFGASVMGIGPYALRGTARRVVVPYGWLRRAAAIALASGAQRSVCGAVTRSKRESPQRPSQKGDRPATAGAAL